MIRVWSYQRFFNYIVFFVCILLGNSLASELQTPVNYPEESVQHSEQRRKFEILEYIVFVACNVCDWRI